jgi:hypothetical protein
MGDVYFLEGGRGGLVKIGFSTNLDRRFRLLRTANPKIRLIGTVPGTIHDEQWWHRELAAHRVAGEWFKLPPNAMSKIMSAILETGWTEAELWQNPRNNPEVLPKNRK